MRVRTIVVVLAVLLLAAFAALNWSVFVAPTDLNLLVVAFSAPLGLLLLGAMVVLVAAFAVYMAAWQAQVLKETRQHTKELERQRLLAEQAESSRLTEVSALVRAEVQRLAERLEQAEAALHADIRDNSNSLAASFAEMDDRWSRGGKP